MWCSSPAAACAGCSQEHNKRYFFCETAQAAVNREGMCRMKSHHTAPQGTRRVEEGSFTAEGHPMKHTCSYSGLMFPLPSPSNSGEQHEPSRRLIASPTTVGAVGKALLSLPSRSLFHRLPHSCLNWNSNQPNRA